MNVAQQIRHALGIAIPDLAYKDLKTRNASQTKLGPGRRHINGDGKRTAKQKSAGAFGRGLRNNITRKQFSALQA